MVVNMDRRYSKGADVQTFSDLSNMSRAEVKARYAKSREPDERADRLKARSTVVRKYRAKPQLWPDGIDRPGMRWYRPEDWTRDGKYVGPEDGPGTRSSVSDEEMAAVTAPASVTAKSKSGRNAAPPGGEIEPPVTAAAVTAEDGVTAKCEVCGKPLAPSKGANAARQRFCSAAHRVQAARAARKRKRKG
jgi:hypothetical protein